MILDVGCGGNFDNGFGERKNWAEGGFRLSVGEADICCDVRKPIVSLGNFVLASGESLPFREGVFSLVTSMDVLEHVDSPVKFMRELGRVGSKVLISTPNSLFLPCTLMSMVRGSYVPHGDHVAVWSKAELTNLFKRVGMACCVGFGGLSGCRGKGNFLVRLLTFLCPFPSLRSHQIIGVGYH